MTNELEQLVTHIKHYLGPAFGTPPEEQRMSFMVHAINHLGGIAQDYAKLGVENERLKKLTSPPAPSGWQQRIAAMDPRADDRNEGHCFFCGAWFRFNNDAQLVCDDHKPYCLWQNAKDALPPSSSEQDPIAAAVNAQLDPLKAELVDIGHKLAKDVATGHSFKPDSTGAACVICGGCPLEHGGEVVVACDCGNRDTITLPLTAMPPCSAGCGRRMRVVGIYEAAR